MNDSDYEKIPSIKGDCPSCGYAMAGKVERESKLITLLRSLVREAADNPAVRLRIEVDDPHYHGFGRHEED